MSNVSSKDILKKEIIFFKELHLYFNYADVKRLLIEKNLQITNSTLKTYLHFFTKEKVLFDAGKGWYSSIEKPFRLNKEPVKEIISTINRELPLLSFSCWSTEQLNLFTHHILSKFITFVYTDSDYLRNTVEILNKMNYSVFENPTKAEILKLFKIDAKTVVMLPSISKQPENNGNYAPIEKILIDFLMENRNYKVMESSEAEKVVEKVLVSGRLNISVMLSYAERRKFNLPKPINYLHINTKGGVG